MVVKSWKTMKKRASKINVLGNIGLKTSILKSLFFKVIHRYLGFRPGLIELRRSLADFLFSSRLFPLNMHLPSILQA
jgi:hypothetical protein